ncbi:CDP-alcohol phosphatidyltransferase family protein [Afifella sp. JA880]|uniref:CDP-alcohol phosphatidyltransferase family protein n=1 Tax=Afifella sp. JA880 TaxID=2975280 RepID=UPI0021BB9F88|nr:CDP-alcohol phosphatidyltransferase family protein [Afifella sp. JA880]MCT8269050.1 CDP-alcohol phosphatidyltransferase family protein [Afifella sp. JA880]
MLDGLIRTQIEPGLNSLGRMLAGRGVTADQVTLAGFGLALLSAGAIVVEAYALAFVLILLGRLADGLDGAVARATALSDRGGFLDITLDFAFYGLVPAAFALADPDANALAAAILLLAFYVNGASFLAFAVMAEKKKITTDQRGVKSLYFTTGLMEGAETVIFFLAFCLFPAFFSPLAYLFASLCAVTTTSRILLGWRTF